MVMVVVMIFVANKIGNKNNKNFQQKELEKQILLHRQEEERKEREWASPIKENSDEKIGEKIFKATVYGRNALESYIPAQRGVKILSVREELPIVEGDGNWYEPEYPFVNWGLYLGYEGYTLEMYHSRGYAGRIVKVARVGVVKEPQDIFSVLTEMGAPKKIKDVFSSFIK